MNKLLLTWVCAAFCAFVFIKPIISDAQAQTRPVRVVVFGDSLTSGYQLSQEKAFPKILQQKLLSQGYNTEVINMSVDGETSTGGASRLDELLAVNPDVVLVQLGINDAIRGIDPTKILYRNLHKMLAALAQKKIGTVLIGAKAPETASRQYKTSLDYVYRRIAQRHQTTLYLDALEGVTGRPDLTLADGLHPNENGVLAMVHNIYPYVARLVKWRIDLQNYEESIK